MPCELTCWRSSESLPQSSADWTVYGATRRIALILLLLALFALSLAAQQPRFAELDAVIQAELEQTKTPGAVVAIVQGDKLVYNKGFGWANVESRQPVTPDMIFRIGSMTKMYTAATLLTLAEEGKIDLHVPIGKYITGLPPRLSAVTAHQLITHTAGLLDRATMVGAHDEAKLAEAVQAYQDSLFFTEPGEVFSYANPGWNIAGVLSEKITGEAYSKAMDNRILKPLGMNHTTMHPTIAMTYPLSVGHIGDAGKPAQVNRPIEDNTRDWPAGFLFSTSSDLARFAIAFMNGGRIDGKQALSEKIIAQMSGTYAPMHSQIENGSYGYGLMSLSERGVQLIEHGGTMSGFASDFVMAPAQRVAVIVLANRRFHLMKTVNKALDVMLPFTPKPAAPKPLDVTASECDEYVGIYMQTAAKVEIVKEGSGLVLKQNGTVPLTKIGKDTFTAMFPGFTEPLRVAFVRGKDGKVKYFHARLRAYKRQ
ncbi:MAG TPA: serine hydrolase domain-containing protein [Blastocatellia bacterium]|nr:serine hydrolase domain-containing protein [Blastocatellia bacterium]